MGAQMAENTFSEILKNILKKKESKLVNREIKRIQLFKDNTQLLEKQQESHLKVRELDS
jgi:hypothetical protein